MTVQTFNPTSLPQSTTNWAVAQRIVGPFAPHAQVVPNLAIMLDPGYLLNGTTLTEVNAQIVGPFSPPTAGFRVDRVVIDRSTGAAAIVTGTANSLTPPAIPPGKLLIARIMLAVGVAAVTNEMISDERALCDLTPQPAAVVCRATRNGVDQSGIPASTWTKVALTTAEINAGSGFDATNGWFKPTSAGYYLIHAQVCGGISPDRALQSGIYRNGTLAAQCRDMAPTTATTYAAVTTILSLNGTTDYVEHYVLHTSTDAFTLQGDGAITFFAATRVG